MIERSTVDLIFRDSAIECLKGLCKHRLDFETGASLKGGMRGTLAPRPNAQEFRGKKSEQKKTGLAVPNFDQIRSKT